MAGHSLVSFRRNGWVFPWLDRSMMASAPSSTALHDFLHFDIIILAVSGNAEVDINLGAQHAADTFGIQAGMILIGTDGHFSLCNQVPSESSVGICSFSGDCFYFGSDDPLSCGIHLCCVISHLISSM